MNIISILIANSIFLGIILIVFVSLLIKIANNHEPATEQNEEDLEKIKEEVSS